MIKEVHLHFYSLFRIREQEVLCIFLRNILQDSLHRISSTLFHNYERKFPFHKKFKKFMCIYTLGLVIGQALVIDGQVGVFLSYFALKL
jgi:hypothetical protein